MEVDAGQSGSYGKVHDNMWVPVAAEDDLEQVKAKIHLATDIPTDKMRLIYKGKVMYESTVQELVSAAGETQTVRVKLTLEMLGGGTSGFMRRI